MATYTDAMKKAAANMSNRSPVAKTTPSFSAATKMKDVFTARTGKTSPMKPPTVPTPTTGTTINDTVNSMSGMINQQPFQFKAPEPFKYDPNSDTAYQAYLGQAKQALVTNQANTNARLRATGQGRSSYSETVANQLGNQAAMDMQNALIQTYLPQAYKQYSDNATMNVDLQKLNYGSLQDKIRHLAGLYGVQSGEKQRKIGNAVTEAGLTGNYVPYEAREALNNLFALKDDTEANWANMTPAERMAARTQADTLRSGLRGMGVDDKLYGADVTANQARSNLGMAGLKTLGGRAQDLADKTGNWGAYMDMVGLTQNLGQGPQNNWSNLFTNANAGSPTYAANQQEWQNDFTKSQADQAQSNWLTEFNNIAQQQGADNALKWAANSIAAGNLALNRDEFDYRKEQDTLDREAAAGGFGGEITAKQSIDNYNVILEDINNQGLNKSQALQLLKANENDLTDSDYRKISDYINKNL